MKIKGLISERITGVLGHFCAHINLVVVVINHCCTSLLGRNSLLSDIVIR